MSKSETVSRLGIDEFVGATEFAYLACLVDEGNRYHRVDQQPPTTEVNIKGTVAEFVEANPALTEQMRNTSLKCAECGKSNAISLPFCNGCNADLTGAAMAYTENVCLTFMYGIEHLARFPAKVSMRYQNEFGLCYDDLLARGSCHLNAIPGGVHLPDWRHLLRNPAKGLALVRALDDMCFKVFQEQFWESDWPKTQLSSTAPSSAEEFRAHVCAGMNSVPSQYQIHLQYIVLPFHPVDYHAFLIGTRFVHKRWLPLEYVLGALEALVKASTSIPDAHNMEQEEIFAKIREVGDLDYEAAYLNAIRRYDQSYIRIAKWSPDNFDFVVVPKPGTLRKELVGHHKSSAVPDPKPDGVEVRCLLTGTVAEENDKKVVELEKTDKTKLQSCGRPFSEEGKPVACSYYKHAREPGQVQWADDWASVL